MKKYQQSSTLTHKEHEMKKMTMKDIAELEKELTEMEAIINGDRASDDEKKALHQERKTLMAKIKYDTMWVNGGCATDDQGRHIISTIDGCTTTIND